MYLLHVLRTSTSVHHTVYIMMSQKFSLVRLHFFENHPLPVYKQLKQNYILTIFNSYKKKV